MLWLVIVIPYIASLPTTIVTVAGSLLIRFFPDGMRTVSSKGMASFDVTGFNNLNFIVGLGRFVYRGPRKVMIECARSTDDVLNRVNTIGTNLLADTLIEARCHQFVMPIEGNFPIRDRQFEITPERYRPVRLQTAG